MTGEWILHFEHLSHEFLQGHARISFDGLEEADGDFQLVQRVTEVGVGTDLLTDLGGYCRCQWLLQRNGAESLTVK